MVEFDVQNIGGVYYLGHPPNINLHTKLEDILSEFENSNVMPKIDLKCSINYLEDIKLLLNKLSKAKFKILVNLGGENLSAVKFMDAEKYLMLNSDSSLLLNIDIARYGNITPAEFRKYIDLLTRKPYSISPTLEGNYEDDIKLATSCDIRNIHFWSNNKTNYSENQLLALLEDFSNPETTILFDINPLIIVVGS